MPYSKNILAFIILLLAAAVAKSQVAGCTDPFASNYNAAATVNNGSCLYTAASYTPVIKVDPITDSLIESSGLQMAGGYLWSFNDKDGKPSLYRIDTITNTLLQRVILEGATNDDWEDIAFDGTYMYVGDFGNNYDGARTNLKIYKFLFSAIHDYTTHPADTVPAQQIQVINFKYSDQPQPPVPTVSNLTKFDCEAMIVLNGKIHLFSKNWIDNTSTHYIISDTSAGSYIVAPLETLPTGYLVTAADKVAGQDIIVLLGYQNSGLGNHYMHILSGYNGDTLFAGNKRMISLGDATAMGQSEGITFRNNKYGYISNEKFVRIVGPFTITVNQKLRSFDIANFVGDHFTKYIFTGNGNWSNAANWRYHAMPPPNILAGNEILIDPAANGACKLNIQYTIPAGAKLTVSTGKSFIVNGNLTVQ